jgi:hypothetical protein
MVDLARGVRTRFTFGVTNEYGPVWSPDGARIAYSITAKVDDIFLKSSGGGQEEVFLRSGEDKKPTDWSTDGNLLVFDTKDLKRNTRWDIAVVPVSGKREPRFFLKTEFNETGGKLSPDGRWMLYGSDESGRNELYVAPFPGPGGKWQISTGGAIGGFWARGGAEIIYLAYDYSVMSVGVRAAGASFEVDNPQQLFQIKSSTAGDTAADGQRFLVAMGPETRRDLPISLVSAWPAGLHR